MIIIIVKHIKKYIKEIGYDINYHIQIGNRQLDQLQERKVAKINSIARSINDSLENTRKEMEDREVLF